MHNGYKRCSKLAASCEHRGPWPLEAMAPDELVPVHTFEGDRFSEFFGMNVCRRMDGEW